VRKKLLLVVSFLTLAILVNGELQAQVRPPQQPASGPGGAEAAFQVRESTFGSGGKQYWLFEPVGIRGSAPVVAFLHGWGAMQPDGYKLWIEHIAARGNIVIYPRYQQSRLEPGPNMTPNAVAAIQAALSRLGARADRSKFALVGHSMGAAIAFNLAAKTAGLPEPRAVMSVEPGDIDSNPLLRRMRQVRQVQTINQIPRGILALILVGDEDKIAGDRIAKVQFSNIQHVPCENKNYIIVQSDRHGSPPLIANHFAPAAIALGQEAASDGPRGARRDSLASRRANPPAEESLERAPTGFADALDFYGYWKLFDALTDAAFHGRNREYALGGGPKQTFMGTWSDGKPVQPLIVSNAPGCKAR
jgi:pimeloyl-ACP methyl ester carboxylesterase